MFKTEETKGDIFSIISRKILKRLEKSRMQDSEKYSMTHNII